MEKVHTFVSGGKRYPIEDVETSEALAREAERSQTADIEFTGQIALLDNKISAEKQRAEGAERNLQTAIDNEAKRAVNAENAISIGLQAEKTRAKEAENALDEKIETKHNEALAAVGNEVENLKDGNIIVGQAREIYSRNGKTVTDSFLARTTAGSGTIGDGVATLKSVGGNIVKNLVDGTFESGWTSGITHKENNIITIVPPSNYDGARFGITNVVPNHKYYAAIFASGENAHLLAIIGFTSGSSKDLAYSLGSSPKKWAYLSAICTNDANYTSLRMRIGGSGNKDSIYAAKPIFIDLTEMFGAGKEPTKEECDRLFGTMDALPQGLTIANPTSFKSVGYNLFNPENVLKGKTINENGAIIDNVGTDIAIIECLPCKIGSGENNGLCIHGDFELGSEKVYLTPLNPLEVEGELYMHELTPDADKGTYVPQVKGYMLVVVPNTTNLCIHFLWSEDRDKHDYEPYHESVVELPVIREMPEYGLAGMYVNGELVADTIDLEKGIYTKRLDKDSDGNFQPLAEPIEYPLPKVANNYISSDYGVEQFLGSAIPCNANNLYYMRSLAGETRNFLDRLMSGLGTDDATAVADRILAVVNPAAEPANVEPEEFVEP